MKKIVITSFCLIIGYCIQAQVNPHAIHSVAMVDIFNAAIRKKQQIE